ncbi:MAG TPA: PEGA domain-containing protein [Polyangiaceae bacterium]|nr:PEGA domain-containing protein [Polyangiaceae bacterium]
MCVVVGLLAGLATTTLVAAPAAAQGAPTKPAPAAAKPAATPAAKPAAAPAAAKPPTKKQKDAARKAYGEGEKAFNAGQFAVAEAAFTRANEAIHSSQADFWIAKSLDQQNKTEEAIAAYQTFLDDPDAAKAGDQKVSEAKTRQEALKAMLVAEIAVETDPMLANIAVDGAPQQGEAPMTLKLPPGKHRLTVSSQGYQSKDVDIEVKGGDHMKQSIVLTKEAPPVAAAAVVAAPPPPPQAPPPPPPPEEHSKVPAYVTLGIAGVAGVVGTIFGVKALNSKSDFDKTPTTKLADDTERSALIADMAFGVAITLGVTGIVLLTSDDAPPPATAGTLPLRRAASTRRLELAPYAGPKGGGASAKLTF